MILIGGTTLALQDLPFHDIMSYTIEPDLQHLSIKLRTVAKGPACLAVYLSSALSEQFTLSEDVLAKTIVFTDDDHLFSLLDNGGKEATKPQPEPSPEVLEAQNDVVFGEEVQSSQPPEVSFSDQEDFQIHDVDLSLQEQLLTIPNSDDDVDSLKQQLTNSRRMVDQLNANLADMKNGIDDVYRLQEIQLLEMKEAYEKRVDEAHLVVEDLKTRLVDSAIPPEQQWFLKYATYAKNHKASLREGFSTEDMTSLRKLKSKFFIFASGAGDSHHTMMKNVFSLISTRRNLLVVDFSNDYFLTAKYQIQTKDSSMLLNNDDVPVQQLIRQTDGLQLIPSSFYNDIALLNMDWVKILAKLAAYAEGKTIILLFNSINSFSVRYSCSKLATVGSFFIFAKSSPIVLATLTGDIAFIPEDRFKLVAMDYIDVVKPVLDQISAKHLVLAFKEAVNWSKLGF